MKYLKALLLSAVLASLTPMAYAADQVKVHDAWIPQAPPVAGVMAAYMVVENTGSKPVTITGVDCNEFGMVMMHKTVTENGVSRMIHLGDLKLAPKSKAVFHRGGMHVMLMQPKHAFKVGDKVPMTLELADKHKIKFTAVVKPASMDVDKTH